MLNEPIDSKCCRPIPAEDCCQDDQSVAQEFKQAEIPTTK